LLLLFVSVIALSQSTRKLHNKAILVNTHNDVLSSQLLEGKDISHRLIIGHRDFDRWNEAK
jgi:membrane dipeptidase